MKHLFMAIRQFLCDEEGVTIIEYALMAALIALGVVATVILVKNEIVTLYTKINNCLASTANC